MIAVITSFTDDPTRLELRPRHRELLTEMHEEGLLVAAGPFADQSGALLLFETDDVAQVKAALARDPYYSAPGVSIVTIQPWTVVAGDL
ncbi:YciI family protein [Agrococcus beijingensis]|uniref:YciI family protein n=1 Tax=Agrococcus beijingensis TaxID=3068634 RepID=UPI002741FFEF|nr:YciI family protein [Agrococcus sp. REN33]